MSLLKILNRFNGEVAQLESMPPLQLLEYAAVSLAIGFSAWIIAVIIYRIWFHPLAKYPGPLLGKITSFYDFFVAYGERRAQNFGYMHEKYGRDSI